MLNRNLAFIYDIDIKYRGHAVRALIDIPDTQIRALAALCEKVKQPRAVIIRDAIAEYLARHQRVSNDEAFGLWTADAPDGVDFQRAARTEW